MILEEIIRKQKLEIERLEKNNVRALEMASSNMIKMQSLKVEKQELQERIDKAIEYIKECTSSPDKYERFISTGESKKLLEILKGEDKE